VAADGVVMHEVAVHDAVTSVGAAAEVVVVVVVLFGKSKQVVVVGLLSWRSSWR